MSEPRKPPFRAPRSSGPSRTSGGAPSRGRAGFAGAPRPERFLDDEGGSSVHELLEMADSLARQARELNGHAALLRRLAADLQEGGERPRPRTPRPGGGRGGPGRGNARPEGRGFGGEERPRQRGGEAPAWVPKKRKK